MRQIENTPTAAGDTPLSPCMITASGQLSPDDPSLNQAGAVVEGDIYEDYPDDEENIDIGKPENALQVRVCLEATNTMTDKMVRLQKPSEKWGINCGKREKLLKLWINGKVSAMLARSVIPILKTARLRIC